MRVTVLGAGLAGLSAAVELAGRGVDTVVMEKESCSGGLASTVRRDDFCYDLGPHRFHTLNPELLSFIEDLPGINLLELERVSRIRLLDRYFSYPLSMGNVLSTMPLRQGASMMFSYIGEKVRGLVAKREQDSFEGWVLSRFGRGLYNLYLAPYNRKLWGMEPSALSADWASQRITVPSLGGLVRETLFPSREKVRSLVSSFHYPEGGIGEIAGALEKKLASLGGRVLHSTEPSEIKKTESGWKITHQAGEFFCSSIVNTIPVPDYVALLGELLPPEVHRASRNLKFRALVFLSVLLDRNVPHKDHWIYTSEDRYLFNRLSITRNFHSEIPSQVVFEFSCQPGDTIWNMTGEELLASTVPGAEHLGLFSAHAVKGFDLSRVSHAYPVYDLSYRESASVVLDALDGVEGSVTCGRQGLFRYNNMDHSIEMGLIAAKEVAGEATVREHFSWNENTWADG
ncbi:hypothetical protein CSA37_04490 [Candidatus Fermentibacteria bacterium]|nr:MAG: hypothetical protein CSA37_04490 [Candidatus Fermentibacteria bacterium]